MSGLVVVLGLLGGAACAPKPPPHGLEDLQPPVAADSIVVGLDDGSVLEVAPDGETRRILSNPQSGERIETVALAPDRGSVFVGLRRVDGGSSSCSGRVVQVHGTDGREAEVVIANDAATPAISPEGSRIAWVHLVRANDVCYRTAISIRNLSTGATATYELPTRVPDGTPPEVPLSWSPDGTKVAYVANEGAQLLDATSSLMTLTPVPGVVTGERLLLPTFLEDGTVAVEVGCCIGPAHLVRIDLATGARTELATAPAAVVSLQPRADGSLVVVTAEGELLVLDGGRTKVVHDHALAADA